MSPARGTPAAYRYGVALAATATSVVFLIIAPEADWAWAIALALQGVALVVAVATSRAEASVRQARAAIVAGIVAVFAVGLAAGLFGTTVASGLGAVMALWVPLAIVRGLVALTRTRGATIQVVAGALAIYLQLGLLFAWLVSVGAHVEAGAYFTQGGDGTQSSRVYFSFTVLTTTGFGDFTAAQPVGRALAVVEMLLGQLYLVTVIGVLVGGLAGRRQA